MDEKKGGNNQEVQRADNETKQPVYVCVWRPGGELVTMMCDQYRTKGYSWIQFFKG